MPIVHKETRVRNYEPVMSFDEEVAALYDDGDVHAGGHPGEPPVGDVQATVAFLEELAGGGPALELAVGTGRIAIPLAQRGITVDGIDLSPAMVARLGAKPGGDRISVVIGNYADVAVRRSYRLIYLVANSLSNLLTQDEQVRCFENVAAHLADGGSFVVEAAVPNWLHRLEANQYVIAERIEVDEVRLDVARHDPATQRLDESHVRLSRDRVRVSPIVTRYAYPGELDLMARIAGLRLKERWDGWNREPFTGTANCISVFGR